MGLISVKSCKHCGRKGFFLTLHEGDLCSVCYQKVQEAREAAKIKAELLNKIKKFYESHSLDSTSRTSTVMSCPHTTPYVILDTETTGLNPSSDKIIQLSAIKYDSTGAPVDFYNTYLNPGRPIPAGASRVNGITDDMVSNAPTAEQVRDDFLSFLGGVLIVGYNVNFDLRFLYHTFGNVFDEWEYVDALTIARESLFSPNYKLETVASRIGFAPDTSFHDSFTDCEAVAAVLHHIGAELDSWNKEFKVTASRPQQESVSSNPYITCELRGKDFETAFRLWAKGEENRTSGDIEMALHYFDMAQEIGYTAPVIYESYAKIYRKLKDYEKEVSILDEGIRHSSGFATEDLLYRKTRAEELMLAQQKRKATNAQKALEKEARAELRRIKEEIDSSKPKKSCKRAVVQCTDDGTIIKEFESVSSAAKELDIPPKSIREVAAGRQKHAGGFCWKYASSDTSNSELTATAIAPDNPFFGKIVVFTGELKMSRAEAMQAVVDLGAFVRTSVSKKTDYLVVGRQDEVFVGDDGRSGKEKKAAALNAAGSANIEIIDEYQFLSIIHHAMGGLQ